MLVIVSRAKLMEATQRKTQRTLTNITRDSKNLKTGTAGVTERHRDETAKSSGTQESLNEGITH